jgi:hypothetical protein
MSKIVVAPGTTEERGKGSCFCLRELEGLQIKKKKCENRCFLNQQSVITV